MILAGMLAEDREALICDLAETYGIFDMRALPAGLLATLSVGLRNNSRIKMKLAGAKTDPDLLMLAAAVDRLSLLVWAQTKDGAKGRNRPASIVDQLNRGGSRKEKDVAAFESPEEFEAARARILRGS